MALQHRHIAGKLTGFGMAHILRPTKLQFREKSNKYLQTKWGLAILWRFHLPYSKIIPIGYGCQQSQ